MSQPSPAQNALHQQLLEVNQAFVNVFNDYTRSSPLLTKKHTASLMSQIFGCLEDGPTEAKNRTRESFLACFRSYAKHFIDNHIVAPASSSQSEASLVLSLIEKWEHFKKFTFYHFTILQNANNYYETAYKAVINQGKSNKLEAQTSVFPIPVLAVHYFNTLVISRYHAPIQKHVLKLFAEERTGKVIEKEHLRGLCEMVYSCGLGELARIKSVKEINGESSFRFYASNFKEITKQFSSPQSNPEQMMRVNLLERVMVEAILYYKVLFEDKIIQLSPYEDFHCVLEILEQEEARSAYYLLSDEQRNYYMSEIRRQIVERNLRDRLLRENSFKSYLQKFSHGSDAYLGEIQTFMKPVLSSKASCIKIVEEIVKSFLEESGERIAEKINKRRQYISDIVELKKSINRVIEEAMDKNWEVCMMRDKCFKKILDSIEASRNLAEFADWRIKECIKAKLNEEETLEKLRDVFLVMENLAATDSFLIYHQEMQGKRLLEALNDPKIETEMVVLNKMAEKLGSVSVSPHLNMIKDIEQSQELTDRINKILPFSRFRWSLRIITPSFWADNINRSKLSIQLPEAIRMQAENIANIFHEQSAHRYLNWKLERGFSMFEGRFPGGKYRFQSENVFMMLLFHISESPSQQILFGNLQQKINKQSESDTDYLMKCVGVLIENGLVTRDSPNAKAPLTEGESLRINTKYTPPSGQNKPNQVILVRVSPEMHRAMHQTSVEHGKIQKEREKVVEAVLVKLLKHSHSTGGNHLTFKELYKGIREHQHLRNFEFSEAVIKQRLEQLIARGYCERDEKDRRVYHYVA